MGNNISDKTLEQIENYILNISSYEAEMDITIESNKNTNKYIITQKFTNGKIAKQEIIEPENIKGMIIEFDGNDLKITNSKLNIVTMYKNYNYILDNVLWLSDFIETYKQNNGTITEENGIIIMEVVCNKNKYFYKEKLYIDRNANKIVKLLIEDENNKNKIYITYNKIEIGSLNIDNVLAFKQKNISKNNI